MGDKPTYAELEKSNRRYYAAATYYRRYLFVIDHGTEEEKAAAEAIGHDLEGLHTDEVWALHDKLMEIWRVVYERESEELE